MTTLFYGCHPRCGALSPVRFIGVDAVRLIVEFLIRDIGYADLDDGVVHRDGHIATLFRVRPLLWIRAVFQEVGETNLFVCRAVLTRLIKLSPTYPYPRDAFLQAKCTIAIDQTEPEIHECTLRLPLPIGGTPPVATITHGERCENNYSGICAMTRVESRDRAPMLRIDRCGSERLRGEWLRVVRAYEILRRDSESDREAKPNVFELLQSILPPDLAVVIVGQFRKLTDQSRRPSRRTSSETLGP